MKPSNSDLTGRRQASRRSPPAWRPSLEALEDRLVPAFVAPVHYDAGAYPQALATGLFNVDSALDLVVANYSDSTVSVLLGNGDGTFQTPPSDSSTGSNPMSLAVGDFNEDGKLDLATATPAGVSVLLGKGDGTFEEPTNLNVNGDPRSVAVGDFNGDGNMDLGVTSNVYYHGAYHPGFYDPWYGYWYPGYYDPGYYEGRMSVLLGNGEGGFSEPNTTSLGYGYRGSATVAADLNGDTYDDLALAYADNWSVSVLLGDASGYLQGPSDFSAGYYPSAVAAGDVDGDLDTDLVVGVGQDVSVLLGDGAGNFGDAVNYAAGTYSSSIVLGDFTHDGNVDIAAVDSSGVSVIYGAGDGTFGPFATTATGVNSHSLVSGYFDNDGWLDAATANYEADNSVSVLLNSQEWRAFQVSGYPAQVIVGEPHSITVTAFDASGNVITDYTGTIHFDSSDPDAELPDDYTFLPSDNGTATFEVTLNTTGTQSISVNDTLTTTISGSQTGIFVNPPPPATLSIDNATVTEGNNGTVAATFKVTRADNLSGEVTVNYSTANGDALADSDYVSTSGSLTFGPGVTELTITVTVNGDLTDEFDQIFYVYLSDATGANIIDSQGVGTIMDNDPPPTITITPKVSLQEGKQNGTKSFDFIVTLSAPSEKEVRVNFATANGTARTTDNDYVAKSGTLVFAAGQTSKTISVLVKGDKKKESNETFSVNLSGATNATLVGLQGIGEILDDDTPSTRGRR